MPNIRIKKFDGGETDHYLDVKDPSYSERLENVVFDADGKILSREGFEHLHLRLKSAASSIRALHVTKCNRDSYGLAYDSVEGTHLLSVHNGQSIDLATIENNRIDYGAATPDTVAINNFNLPSPRIYSPIAGLRRLKGVTHDYEADRLALGSVQAEKSYATDTNIAVVYTFDTYSPPIAYYDRLPAGATDSKYHWLGLSPVEHGVGIESVGNSISLPDDGLRYSYIWYFHAYYTYTLPNDDIITVSGPVFQRAFTFNEPLDGSRSWSHAGGLVLDEKEYDGIPLGTPEYPAGTRIAVYRTYENSTESHYVEDIALGAAFSSDTNSDLQLSQVTPPTGLPASCYIDGGVLDNDPPDAARYSVFTNNILWLANTKEHPNRLNQGKSGNIHAFPGSFATDFESDITGLKFIDIYPIVFTESGQIYRMEGIATDTGAGQSLKRLISRTAGCRIPHSIVQHEDSIYWLGLDGVYVTNGYKVTRVTKGLDTSLKSLLRELVEDTGSGPKNKRNSVTGAYCAVNKRIYWNYKVQEFGYFDTILCFDVKNGAFFKYYKIPEQDPSLITKGDGYHPSALACFAGSLLVGDVFSGLFAHKDYLVDDILIDTFSPETTYGLRAVLFDWTTSSIAFNTEYSRKWVTSLIVRCKNFFWEKIGRNGYGTYTEHSTLSLQISSINDDDKANEKNLKEIYETNDDTSIRTIRRRFPCGGLRCHEKQLRFRRALATLFDSVAEGFDPIDFLSGNAYYAAGGLDARSSNTSDWWEGHYLFTSYDNFAQGHQITSISDGTIVVDAALPDAVGLTWIIKGYPKNERFRMESIEMEYTDLGESAQEFSGD